MSKVNALSLHIGLNRIDPAHYGTDGALANCENDATVMRKIAESTGFTPRSLINEAATADAVLAAIRDAARQLEPDGIFLLTYAGHGSQVEDLDGDELKSVNGTGDGLDETWCLYDRMLVDDELHRCWAEFPSGARIAFFSDSCHSGTMSRELQLLAKKRANGSRGFIRAPMPRAIDPEFANIAVKGHFEQYRHLLARGPKPEIGATVILISGCQDRQTSSDGEGSNGHFTGTLLDVWANGAFEGTYPSFHEAIRVRMPSNQIPNYTVVGASNPGFTAQKPFTTTKLNTGARDDMNTIEEVSERVAALIKRPNGAGTSASRGISGGCSIGIGFDRQILNGFSDEKLLAFFQNDVAPRMLDNWLTLNQVVTPVRGGEISCTASTGGGGSISCSGTIRF